MAQRPLSALDMWHVSLLLKLLISKLGTPIVHRYSETKLRPHMIHGLATRGSKVKSEKNANFSLN